MSTTRSRTNSFDEFDEFDHLLDDDEPTQVQSRARTAAAPRSMGSDSTGSQKATKLPRPRLSADVNWNRIAAVGFLGVLVLFVLWFAVTNIQDSRRNGAYRTTSVR